MFLNYIIISRKFTRLKFDFQGVLLKSIERKPTSSNTLARESGKGRREREEGREIVCVCVCVCVYNTASLACHAINTHTFEM